MDFNIFITISLLILALLFTFNVFAIAEVLRRSLKQKSRIRLKLAHIKHPAFLLNIGFLIAVPLIGYYIYSTTTPHISSTAPRTESLWENYDKPIEISFNMPVDANKLTPNMNPAIKGRWEWQPYLGFDRLTKVGKFYPEETLFPNQRIVIYLTGIARIGNHTDNHEGGIVLQSVSLPEVKATYPFHNRTNIETDDEILILFNKPIEDLAEFDFKLQPNNLKLNVEQQSNTLFKLIPEIKLQQSTDYILSIERTPKRVDLTTKEVIEKDNSSVVHKLHFTTVKEPFIKSITPKGSGIKPDNQIRFRFEVDMDREIVESKIKIEPELNGSYSWQDNRTLLFKSTTPFEKGTKYSIKIEEGMKSLYGGLSEKSFEHEFETIGKIKADDFSPANGTVRVNVNTNISLTFDQEVDKESAQQKFSVSPSVKGGFNWEGNKLIFNPEILSFSTTYTVTLQPGIKSLYGIDSDAPISFSFTTRSQEIVISMPWYAQPQSPVSFTCNIVSAQMALAWKGYSTSAQGLISEIGYNSNHNGSHWTGNPYKEFVGCADGFCGYGVYWTALQKVFSNRGIHTEIRNGFNVHDLARSIENGQPVIIWRYNGTSNNADADWIASDGTYIDAISGQHGGVVTGYRGTIDNPTAFYINDPWFGLIWMDRNTFDYYWSRLNRSSLIIY